MIAVFRMILRVFVLGILINTGIKTEKHVRKNWEIVQRYCNEARWNVLGEYAGQLNDVPHTPPRKDNKENLQWTN